MSSEPTQNVDREQRVDEVIAAYLKALQAGQQTDRAELLARHPDLAEELTAFFADQDRFQGLAQPLRTVGMSAGVVRYFGDYELLGEIARGGMGVVYRARQRSLNRIVALKMIRDGQLASPEDVQRFHREAEAAAQLDHPNIVPIYEVGEHESQHYFSMKLIEGGSLAHVFSDASQKRLPNPTLLLCVAKQMATIARALHYAHQRGILHRDLKPANILLDLQDQPHVTDFGLARRLESEASLTRSGAIIGTPSYMAPEQAGGQKGLTTAADVYSLGAVLYELLTGQPPFRAETVLDTLLQVREREPLRPRLLNPQVDRDLETICLKCLEKQPQRRYGSAEALAEDLEHWLAGEPLCARPAGPAERLWRWCRRNPALAATGGLAAAALLAATLVSVLFAIHQYHSAQQIAQEQRETEEARDKAQKNYEESQKNYQALQETAAARRRALLQAADLVLHPSSNLFNQNDPAIGMLWLARCLTIAPDDAADLQFAIRTNLAFYGRRQNPLKGPLLQHEDVVTVAVFSPDGKSILTGSDWRDGTARRWDAATGKPLGPPLPPPKGHGVYAVAFSPNGKTLLTGSGHTAGQGEGRLWDAATGKQLGRSLKHQGPVVAVAFSPDGKTVLTASLDRTARLWDAATGFAIGEPLQHENQVVAAAFSPNGKTVLTASQETAQLWDTATGEPLGQPLRHQGKIYTVAYSPDGRKILTAGADRTARLWDADTGEPVGRPLKHQSPVKAAAFSPDGKMVLTGSEDGNAQLWEADTGEPLSSGMRHQGPVNAVAFSADGKRLATATGHADVSLWRTAPLQRLDLTLWHPSPVLSVAFHPDSNSVLTRGEQDKVARLWDVAREEKLPRPVLWHNGAVHAVAVSPDGRTILTGNQDGSVRRWDVKTGKEVGKPFRHADKVWAVAFRRDGSRILTASEDETARQWDTATGQALDPPLTHEGPVWAAVYSPDGKTVLTGSADRSARFWDAATGKPRGQPLRHEDAIITVAYSPDGKTALTGSRDRTARLWNVATGKPIAPPLRHQGWVQSVAFSPDGKTALTASDDQTLRLWDAATGQSVGPLLRYRSRVGAVAFSPDGRMIALGSEEGSAQLIQTDTIRFLGGSMWHRKWINAVAFSPDGRILVTGSTDGSARIWDVPAPLTCDVERILLWTQVLTGMELDTDGVVHVLNPEQWHQRRQRLQKLGGPPLP
jgi:WD40 repeat protein/tRNA A-37 threonylcarbamoyl transferase component Bud32